MAILFERGAFRVMCKYIQLKDNTWYFRRRIPLDVRKLHLDPVTNKPQTQLFHSLKTTSKAEAAKEADVYTRRLEARWKAHREDATSVASHIVSLATIEHAGLRPGDGMKHAGHDRIDSFIDGLIG